MAWQEAFGEVQLRGVEEDLASVARTYATYVQPGTNATQGIGIKRLSQRETAYLQKTHSLLQVMMILSRIDARLHGESLDVTSLGGDVARVLEALNRLQRQFSEHQAEGPSRVVDAVLEFVQGMAQVLDLTHASNSEKLTSLIKTMQSVRGELSRGTWPLPARACPVGGLGRGEVTVLREDIPGSGTEVDPYRFQGGMPAVLNIVADIAAMAPGGTTTSSVSIQLAGEEIVRRLSAVEGQTQVTFVLPDVLSPQASTVCSVRLVFDARDCHQIAAEKLVFLRRV